MSNKKKNIGFKHGINKGNGFAWVQLHYTADPAKRSQEWKQRAKHGMSEKAWLTEMELSWESYAGEPVYGSEFNRELHIMDETFEPDPEYPQLLRGWDFGGNHSCVVAQYLNGTLYVLDEYANMGYNTRRIATQIQEDCALRWGENFTFTDIIDPSGMWEGKTSDGKACADIMRELGMELIPGEQDPSRRIDAVMRLLVTMQGGKPKLQLNSSCKMLIEGFLGGYAYPEKIGKNVKKAKPEKGEHSHIHDALQYVATKLDARSDAFLAEIDLTKLRGGRYDL